MNGCGDRIADAKYLAGKRSRSRAGGCTGRNPLPVLADGTQKVPLDGIATVRIFGIHQGECTIRQTANVFAF
jgi:hypothetical protein